MLETFVDALPYLEIEESTSTAELAGILKESRDEKIKFILLTNARRSDRLQELKNFFVRGKEVEYQIWDIERIFAVSIKIKFRSKKFLSK